MKKLFMLALLCLSFVASKAASLMVYNKTNCDIVVSAICYDPQQCVIFNYCPPGIIVPAGSSIPLPNCPQCQVPFQALAYQVCWANPQCPPPNCVIVAPVGPCFPAAAALAACQPCNTAKVFFDAAGNLIVQ